MRSIAARTCDLLDTAARVAELLHPDLRLEDRVERLSLRLNLGIPGLVVNLARYAGTELTRGDYLRLTAAQLIDPEVIAAADDDALLSCLDGDRRRLAIVRDAAAELARANQHAKDQLLPQPQLAAYSP